MRARIVLAVAAAVAAATLPAQPASAYCIAAYETVTGRCNPCNDVNGASQNLHERYGTPELMTNCFA